MTISCMVFNTFLSYSINSWSFSGLRTNCEMHIISCTLSEIVSKLSESPCSLQSIFPSYLSQNHISPSLPPSPSLISADNLMAHYPDAEELICCFPTSRGQCFQARSPTTSPKVLFLLKLPFFSYRLYFCQCRRICWSQKQGSSNFFIIGYSK